MVDMERISGIEMIRNINAVEVPMHAHNFLRRPRYYSSRTSVSRSYQCPGWRARG